MNWNPKKVLINIVAADALVLVLMHQGISSYKASSLHIVPGKKILHL